MQEQTFTNGPGYFFILTGLVLTTLSAVVPFFNDGYEVQFGVFCAGLLPWLVYGIAVPLMRGALTTVCGLLLVIADGWLVVTERYIGNADYSDNTIYLVPIILSVLLLPLVIVAVIRSKKEALY